MTFKIGDNAVSKRITLEQLINGLDKNKDKKKIERITQIFNQYNTNTERSSADALDIDEQITLMNDLHSADGDGKGKDFDGKISGKGLKKAGLKGEYKAYRDFVEAYQKAVAADEYTTYDLSFKDGTADGVHFIETKAVRDITVDGTPVTETHQYDTLSKDRKIIYEADGNTKSYSPKGQLLRQKLGKTVIRYKNYDSEARNAAPGIVEVRNEEQDGVNTFKLQADGTYLNEEDNCYYKLNNGVPEKIVKEELKPEIPNEEPKQELKSEIPDEEPKQEQPAIKKPTRPKSRTLIRMTSGWKNQKVKPDADMTEKFNSMSKADEILSELVAQNEAFKEVNLNTDELLSDLIKNNPSVFAENGDIYADARWDRLDFPKDLARYKND